MEQVKKTNKVLKIITRILLILLLAVCALIIFFNLTHSYYVVYGPSMAPTLNEGIIDSNAPKDGVFISKIKSYGRGDIIVLNKNYGVEGSDARFVIKRLIAIGGDKINVKEHNAQYRIFIIKAGSNKEEILEEKYISDYVINVYLYNNFNDMVSNLNIQRDENGYITIPKDEVFVLGDNRGKSTDSSTYGSKDKRAIVGKVDYIAYGNKDMYLHVVKQIFGCK